MSDGLRTERDGAVAVVTIDRPERRNALDVVAMRRLAAALREASTADDVGAVVLTGNSAFCAGADLKHVVERQSLSEEERRADVREAAQGLTWSLVESPVPVLAAVDGPAVGLGFDLALACDDRLIGPDGWCMQGWGRIGAIPATGGELLLRLRNPTLLWRLLAEQPRITGPDAERWHLGQAVADGPALPVALLRAHAIAALPRAAVHAYVRLSRAALRRDLTDHLAACAEEQPRLLADQALASRVEAILGGTP